MEVTLSKTLSNRDLLPNRCITLGNWDFIRVPFPAASTATATIAVSTLFRVVVFTWQYTAQTTPRLSLVGVCLHQRWGQQWGQNRARMVKE